MDLEIKWHQPVELIDGSRDALILKLRNLDKVFAGAGVYMFCRRFDSKLSPLYIGKSINIQKRIKQHLNSVKMMKGIETSQKGEKVLVVGELIPKSGQQIEKVIGIIETLLIEKALVAGFSLLNESGTKRPTHQISFNGYQLAKRFSGNVQNVKA